MTALEFLKMLSANCGHFRSRDRPGSVVSNAELRRWCDRRSVEINGSVVGAFDEIEFPVTGVVLFRRSPMRVTLR